LRTATGATLASLATLSIGTTGASLAAGTAGTRPTGNEFGKFRLRDKTITIGIKVLECRWPARTTTGWLRHNASACAGNQHCAE
jgi:hypothetical protein